MTELPLFTHMDTAMLAILAIAGVTLLAIAAWQGWQSLARNKEGLSGGLDKL